MNKDQLLALAKEFGLDECDFGDLVQEAASEMASSINNQGMNEQIDFLLKHLNVSDIEEFIRDEQR